MQRGGAESSSNIRRMKLMNIVGEIEERSWSFKKIWTLPERGRRRRWQFEYPWKLTQGKQFGSHRYIHRLQVQTGKHARSQFVKTFVNGPPINHMDPDKATFQLGFGWDVSFLWAHELYCFLNYYFVKSNFPI